MKTCLVIDIDDTLYVHKSEFINYNNIRPDYQLKHLFDNIPNPKFILTNATYNHANLILNKLDVDDNFLKIYSRDNIPAMKPHPHCYLSVKKDISNIVSDDVKCIFFDDLLINLEIAHKLGWETIWISPNYLLGNQYSYVHKSFPTLKNALQNY